MCLYTSLLVETEALSVICIRLAYVVIVLLQWYAVAIHNFKFILWWLTEKCRNRATFT